MDHGDAKTPNAFIAYFHIDEANSLVEIIKTLLSKCKKGKELVNIYYGEFNVFAK